MRSFTVRRTDRPAAIQGGSRDETVRKVDRSHRARRTIQPHRNYSVTWDFAAWDHATWQPE